jgi:hypothetical protein
MMYQWQFKVIVTLLIVQLILHIAEIIIDLNSTDIMQIFPVQIV